MWRGCTSVGMRLTRSSWAGVGPPRFTKKSDYHVRVPNWVPRRVQPASISQNCRRIRVAEHLLWVRTAGVGFDHRLRWLVLRLRTLVVCILYSKRVDCRLWIISVAGEKALCFNYLLLNRRADLTKPKFTLVRTTRSAVFLVFAAKFRRWTNFTAVFQAEWHKNLAYPQPA